MKAVHHFTIHTPPLPHVASFYPKEVYCYYYPCIDDLKIHNEIKPGLLGQSRSLNVDFLNLEVIVNNFLEGLSFPVKPKEVENEKGFLCAKGRGSGWGVKEKQNSIFDDAVMNMDSFNDGISSPSTMNVNVESGSGPTSYVKFVTGEPGRKSVNIRTSITPMRNGADVAIPNNQFMLLVNGLLIRLMWNPDMNLHKEYVGNVLVWVKFHDVLMTVFSEDSLSIIATKLAEGKEVDFGLEVDKLMGHANGPGGLHTLDNQSIEHGRHVEKKGVRDNNEKISFIGQENKHKKYESFITVNDKCVDTHGILSVRKEKRAVSPFSSIGSGGDRSREKRKPFNDEVLKGVEFEVEFYQGNKNKESINSKKKVLEEVCGFGLWSKTIPNLQHMDGGTRFSTCRGVGVEKKVRGFRPDSIFRDRMKNVMAHLRAYSKEKFGRHNEKILLKMKRRKFNFFHSYVKKRNNKCNLRALMINGVRCEEPSPIKEEIARHYKSFFYEGRVLRPVFYYNRVDKITVEEASYIKKEFSKKEVWEPIKGWRSCGFWKRWRYRAKWCNWVDVCLRSEIMSNLVNGSPMEKFGLESEAVENGIFKGVKVGVNDVAVSHLQYEDDTIFFGEWNKENAKSFMCILKCFEEVSGLRVTGGGDLRRMESLWVRIIKSIHGDSREGMGGILSFGRIGSVGGSSMNFLSLNIQGLAQKAKKDWVKKLCIKNKVNLLAIQETKMESMELCSVEICWGNFAFDYVHSDSVGNSGGILCVWDPNSFRRSNTTISNYFIMIRGMWLKTGVNLLIVAVYAPHDLRDKRMLWDYLAHVINQWDSEVVTMGDFNEVRYKSDRFGLVFNVQGADVFNSFIANAGLDEVLLGESSFTWCHKSATKMSKLDRFGNGTMEIGTIRRELLKKYKEELEALDTAIDKGNGSDEIVNKKMEVINSMHHIDKIQAMDMAQKAKIKWSIEGDENSRFFHGVLNKKRSQLNIHGIMVDGVWTEKPNTVKHEFLQHFRRRFDKPTVSRAYVNMSYTKSITIDQQMDLELKHFFTYGDIPKGCNSSFIALILKIPDANLVKDFRPISLIGSIYMIIAKILANRLVGVLGDIVNEVQSAFIVEKQILDGPFILNEARKWEDLCHGCKLGRRLSIRVPLSVLRMLEFIRSHFFNGHELRSNKATRVKWNSVLASKEKGGLGVSSLYVLNRGLMLKWVWRFYSQKTSLWARVNKAIYGDDGKVGKVTNAKIRSCWMYIVNEISVLKNQGVNVFDFMRLKLGNGVTTAFWEDNWIGGNVLKDLYPRIYALETCKSVTVSKKLTDSSLDNSWVWSLESSREFSVASVRKVIDEKRLSNVNTMTRWIKCVPIKVNVLAWKIKIDDLSTRLNIFRQDIDIDSILCPICDCGVESSSHLFFSCSLARQVAHKISLWWDVTYVDVNSYVEWVTWMMSLRLMTKLKLMLECVFYVVWWYL
nr:RNA-directed DNA polymerase, eukaryota [Tanacetum cinerariifolium]